jgi:hypothetical protein
MRCGKILGGVILILGLFSLGFGEDFSLQYFLAKTQSKESELSKTEKTELLNRMEGVMGQVQQINKSLIQAIQTGDLKIDYQEGRFWMSKLEEDRESIETAIQQLRLLEEKPTLLVGAMKFYKSLRDLSSNFNAYNNTSFFSAAVGDLAPEMEIWADPVFYKLYLLPLVGLKDKEPEPPPKAKKPIRKEKKPIKKDKKP